MIVCSLSLFLRFSSLFCVQVQRFCRIYSGAGPTDHAEGLISWVDRLGFDLQLHVGKAGQALDKVNTKLVRVAFPREAIDEQDCRSLLTMMAQTAWESERKAS